MKFGLNTVLWVYPFSSKRLDLLKKVKEFGYDTIEIGVTDWSDKNVKTIEASLKENDLNCVVCGIPGPDVSIISPDKDIQKQGIQFINGLIDLCTKFDSKILVGPTYSVGKYPELIKPEKRKRAWDSCVKNFKVIGKYAREKGVKIAIEPLNRYETAFLNLAEDTVDLVKEVDNENIGVQLDIYHMNIEEKNLVDTIFKTGKYLYHMHVPEHDRGTPGTGHTDWAGVAKALKKISFNECLVIESCDPRVGSPIAEAGAIWRTYDYNQEGLAIRGLKFLKENFI